MIPHLLKKTIDKFIGPVYGHKSASGCKRRYKNSTYCHNFNRFGRIFLNWRPSHNAYHTPNLKVCASLDTLKTILYFDADTHSRGKTADVHTLFDRLREHFPDMPRPVVNGRGGSGWLIVDTHLPCGIDKVKLAATPEEYNETVRQLQTWFQDLGKDLDIEHIEIKGTVYEPNIINGKMLSVKAGDLLKVPPTEEWLTQPVVKYADLKSLAESTPATTPIVPEKPKATKERSGSFHARILTEDQIGNIDKLATHLDKQFPDRPTKAGRYAITPRQFVEIVVALTVLPENADGSQPFKRHKGFINEMQQQDIFTTRYQHDRYKAVREYLFSVGQIELVDARYDYIEHIAMQWHAKDEFKAMVLSVLNNTPQHTIPLIRTKEKWVSRNVSVRPKLVYHRPLLILHSDLEPHLYEYQRKVA